MNGACEGPQTTLHLLLAELRSRARCLVAEARDTQLVPNQLMERISRPPRGVYDSPLLRHHRQRRYPSSKGPVKNFDKCIFNQILCSLIRASRLNVN